VTGTDAGGDIYTGMPQLAIAPRPFFGCAACRRQSAEKGNAHLAPVCVTREAQINGFVDERGDEIGPVAEDNVNSVGRTCGQPFVHQRHRDRVALQGMGERETEESYVQVVGVKFDHLRVQKSTNAVSDSPSTVNMPSGGFIVSKRAANFGNSPFRVRPPRG
jgi:hypothetical protein